MTTSQTTSLTEKSTARDTDHKDVVTTTTVKPDGTKTTVVTDHSVISDRTSESIATESSRNVTKQSETDTYATQLPRWSLGLDYAPRYATTALPYNPKAFTPSVGYRLVGTVWIQASYHLESSTAVLGVRVEF